MNANRVKTCIVDGGPRAWNGGTIGRKIGDLALAYDTLFALNKCHSPPTTLVSANISAAYSNYMVLGVR